MTPWTGTKYVNDSLERDKQINNLPRTLSIRWIPKIKIKQTYLSWLEMDRNIQTYILVHVQCHING